MTRKAVVDQNGDVQNVIVADDSFEHPEHDLVDAEDVSVQPGDYQAEDGSFVTPRLTLDAPDTIPNDGTTATVTIENTSREQTTAMLTIEDATVEIEIGGQGSASKDVSTTQAAGETVRVEVGDGAGDIPGDVTEIEVVAP